MPSDKAVSFWDVLTKEHAQIRRRRRRLGIPQPAANNPNLPDQADDGETRKRRRILEATHRVRPLGLAFSGGGIRSATLNLGVIQGLAEMGLLPYVDYLGTVSGGGYIGGWFHGLVSRKYNNDPRQAQDALNPRLNAVPGDSGQDPITFLRKYSNYLAPQLGLFSPDFWVIAAVWIRNMSLNLLILIPFLMFVVTSVLGVGVLQRTADPLDWGALLTAAGMLALAVTIMGKNLDFTVKRSLGQNVPDSARFWDHNISMTATVLLILVTAYLLGARSFQAEKLPAPPVLSWIKDAFDLQIPTDLVWRAGSLAILIILFFMLQWIGGFGKCFSQRHPGRNWERRFHFLWMPLVSALASGALLWKIQQWISGWSEQQSYWLTLTFGPSLTLSAWIAGVVLHEGLMGADFSDAGREWIARLGALLSIAISFWIALFGIAVFGPYWLAWLLVYKLPGAIAALIGWLGAAAGGFFVGKSTRTKGDSTGEATQNSTSNAPDKITRTLDLVGKIAPTVFFVGFLLVVSFGTHLTIRSLAGSSTPCPVQLEQPSKMPDWLKWAVPVESNYTCFMNLNKNMPEAVGIVWVASLLLIVVLPLRFNINEFSMHHFYKNRLVRCYLGASTATTRDAHGQPLRKPNRQSGFDPQDDLPIRKLQFTERYLGPYPVVNCALNLNTGSELSKQERRATSFTFTPMYCGFDPEPSPEDVRHAQVQWWSELNPRVARVFDDRFGIELEGYRATNNFMETNKGPDIGTTIAISGAAANPNSGYHTSAPLAFLMTILNVRLGWWVGNPRRPGPSRRPGPLNALVSLLSELFAQTNGRSRYVNLSDGGHFDNMGLYELVKRRCRYIILSDAEADPDLQFGSLGGAIRKCRADFGVEIDLNVEPLRRKDGFSVAHCVVGRITYPERESSFPARMDGETPEPADKALGWILYFKSSLTGDEQEDVQQYSESNPAFPHQSTANQFFSESQFESYRALGLHIVRSAFENVSRWPRPNNAVGMCEMFQNLAQKWYPAPNIEVAASRLTDKYSELMLKIGGDRDLSALDSSLFPAPRGAQTRKDFYYCVNMIQLMEDVFFDLKLQRKENRNNPSFAGWMSLFRVWAQSQPFQQTWGAIGGSFSPLFREFFEKVRDGVY